MRGYKIIYGKHGYYCWGVPHFVLLGSWNSKIYTDRQKCLNRIKELKEEHRLDGYDFGMFEVDLDIDYCG